MPSEPLTGHQLYHGDTLAPVTAAKLVAAAILVIYVCQIGLYSAGTTELVAAALGDVAVLGLLFVYARRRKLRPSHFGLRKAPPRHFVAAALVGISAWYINLHIVVLIDPPGEIKSLETVVLQSPLATTLLVIALLPALAEELVFRGIFVRALAARVSASIAIVVGALVFAVFHLLPAQMISTFGLGLLLGYMTVRARSVLPAMLAHALNNATAILLAREVAPNVSAWMSANAIIMLVVMVLLLASGVALACRGSRA